MSDFSYWILQGLQWETDNPECLPDQSTVDARRFLFLGDYAICTFASGSDSATANCGAERCKPPACEAMGLNANFIS